MRIRTRLLTAQLIISLLMVVILFALLKWSFDRNFRDYVYEREYQRHQVLLEGLAELYQSQQGWESLRRDPGPIEALLRSPQIIRPLNPPGPPGTRDPQDRPPRRFRATLLDADKNPVFGRSMPDHTLMPIYSGRDTIGWLAIPPRKDLLEANDLAFRRSQYQSIVVIALVAVAISLVFAIVLARQFVRPIQKLTSGARRLAKGAYDTRLQLNGDDELTELGRDFNQLALAQQDSEQARRRWIADISHEIRTPLAVLKGEIEAMQDGVRPLNQVHLDSLHQEARQLEQLVDDLYQLTNTDVGALRYQMESLNLNELVSEQASRFTSLFREHNLQFQILLPAQDIEVDADPTRLQQLLGNLFTNALKYADRGGTLRLILRQERQTALLLLEDSGPGVPEQSLPHLFDHLYRVEDSRSRKTGGSGLGLAICQRIAEAHHGRISAQVSVLGGLRITIQLPVS